MSFLADFEPVLIHSPFERSQQRQKTESSSPPNTTPSMAQKNDKDNKNLFWRRSNETSNSSTLHERTSGRDKLVMFLILRNSRRRDSQMSFPLIHYDLLSSFIRFIT
ncbi:5624_t:CDS:2 [Acaulospora morrowiae]|uniref:5624_t:CDS:1 n=1 Tax=Acaulospora morrowiae TaxID=94023 RepID=A0A9N9DKQ2_9GLOM|nr:5624_t:CDS:2 [Acaulospora morrowiae]